MQKRATMTDIALLAGVSQATVSLVMNDVANARISAETRAKVRSIAEQMGYRRRADVMLDGDIKVIGLLIDDVLSTPFAAQFIEGARLQAAEYGALVCVFCTGANAQTAEAALDAIPSDRLAGVLFTSLVTRTVHPPARLGQTPTILLNCHAPGGQFSSVVPADVTGGFMATKALIDAGHRRVAHIQGEAWGEAARDRALGYRRALSSHDIDFTPEYLVGPAWTVASGRDVMFQLLNLNTPPTALFCFNDRVALGCYEAMAERGLHVGRDISIIGFDNDDLAANLRPALSTMTLPHDEMARWAVAQILEKPSFSPPLRMKIDCTLVARQSIGPAKI